MPEESKPMVTIQIPTSDKETLKKVLKALTDGDDDEPGGSGPKQPKAPGQ